MVNRMRAAAKEENYECEIRAHALQKAENVIEESDIVLIGPQIEYEMARLCREYPGKLMEVINIGDYGRMDGRKVLEHVKKVLESR